MGSNPNNPGSITLHNQQQGYLSMGRIIPYIVENNKMKPPTRWISGDSMVKDLPLWSLFKRGCLKHPRTQWMFRWENHRTKRQIFRWYVWFTGGKPGAAHCKVIKWIDWTIVSKLSISYRSFPHCLFLILSNIYVRYYPICVLWIIYKYSNGICIIVRWYLNDHPTFLWLGASWRILQQVIHWDTPQPINHGAFWQTLPRSCAAAPIWHSLVTFKRNSSSSSSSSQSHVYIYIIS